MEPGISLPEHDRNVRELGCGCVKTVVDHGFARYTELEIYPGCRSHQRSTRAASRPGPSKTLRFYVLARDAFTCQYCGRRAPDVALEVDHVIPVAAGGTTDATNLKTACFDCNRGKRDREGLV